MTTNTIAKPVARVQHNGTWHDFYSIAEAKAFRATITGAADAQQPTKRQNLTGQGGWGSEEDGLCNRCGGGGVFKQYGSCFRCGGEGKAPGATMTKALATRIAKIKATRNPDGSYKPEAFAPAKAPRKRAAKKPAAK